jgi:outer membrane receptor protein involved in Fe transport
LDEVWRVALLGKNLTDEHTIAYASEMRLAYNETGAATWTGMVDAPRSFSVQLSYKW